MGTMIIDVQGGGKILIGVGVCLSCGHMNPTSVPYEPGEYKKLPPDCPKCGKTAMWMDGGGVCCKCANEIGD
jgi:hypothetical protein